jgi:hypothetical protein
VISTDQPANTTVVGVSFCCALLAFLALRLHAAATLLGGSLLAISRTR